VARIRAPQRLYWRKRISGFRPAAVDRRAQFRL